MPAKQWPAARNAWSRLAGPATNELVPELGSTENLPDIAGRVGFMPRVGGCVMARWGRGWVSAPAQHRDHLRAVPPACRARNLTRNLTRLTGWKSVKRPPARLADRSGPLVFAGWQAARPCLRRARARTPAAIHSAWYFQSISQTDFVPHFAVLLAAVQVVWYTHGTVIICRPPAGRKKHKGLDVLPSCSSS